MAERMLIIGCIRERQVERSLFVKSGTNVSKFYVWPEQKIYIQNYCVKCITMNKIHDK
jgi:hypothetical protein